MKQQICVLYNKECAAPKWVKKLNMLCTAVAVAPIPSQMLSTLPQNADFVMLFEGTEEIDGENLARFFEILCTNTDKKIVYGDRKNQLLPGWSPDLLLAKPYMGAFVAVEKELFCKILQTMQEEQISYASMDVLRYAVILHATEQVTREAVKHIPLVLGNAEAAFTKEHQNLLKETLRRRGIGGTVEKVGNGALILYDVPRETKVRIIIPSKDHPDLLFQCINTIEMYTESYRYEITVVDNGSTPENRAKIEAFLQERNAIYLYEASAFNFSAMCNAGAKGALEEVLLFLNDDIEVKEEYWLDNMLGQCLQKHTGAVGAKLVYPTRELQHTGICMLEQNPTHMLLGLTENQALEKTDRTRLNYNYLAVTAACLMVKREAFEELGGFDEALPVAFNDVDLCMCLYKQGYYNVVCENVTLIHHESLSRGQDTASKEKQERLQQERDILWKKHPDLSLSGDPFYHPFFSTIANEYIKEEYPYPCDISKRVGSLEKFRYEQATLAAYIDSVRAKENGQLVEGWYFYKNGMISKHTKLCIITKNAQGERSVYATSPRVRLDIAKQLQVSYDTLGFAAMVPKEEEVTGVLLCLPGPMKNKLMWSK